MHGRPPTPAEREAYAAVRLHAVHVLMPYLATAVFRLRPWWVDGLGTFAVDARWRVLVDPVVLERWGVPAAAGVLLHEVGHALRGHAEAAAGEGTSLDPWAWNLCGDAAINDDLVRSGVRLPGEPVLPGDLRDVHGRPLPEGGTARAYYDALPVRDEVGVVVRGAPGTAPDGPVVRVPGRRPSVDGSCGSVAGGVPHDVDLPADADGVDDTERELARRATAEAVRAAARDRGDVPAGLRRWAADELSPPQVPWQQRLRGAVRRGVAAVAGSVDTTYARPSRRRVPGVVLPGTRRPLPSVACVVDTSASMTPDLLAAALAEVDGVARAAGGRDGVRVLVADAAVHGARRVRRAADVALVGGGGTDLRPALADAVAGRDRPDVVVVLTDGGTPWHELPPDRSVRYVVALTLPPGGPAAVAGWHEPPAWATVVEVPTTGHGMRSADGAGA